MARRRHTVMWLVGPQTLMTRDPNWECHESMDMRLRLIPNSSCQIYIEIFALRLPNASIRGYPRIVRVIPWQMQCRVVWPRIGTESIQWLRGKVFDASVRLPRLSEVIETSNNEYSGP